jgi:hypothetical protein
MKDKALFRSGVVWLLAGLAVTLYATIGILLEDIPGIQQLIAWLESFVGMWVLVAVFIAIVIEGLYFVGSFFPGSSIVIVLAILTQSDSPVLFWLTIVTIFFGWLLSSVINIYFANKFRLVPDQVFHIEDRMLLTWLPAFRANYEVAQVVAGADPLRVFISSARVKLFGSAIVTLLLVLVTEGIDVNQLSNDEGFATMYISASIMIAVGVWQIRKCFKQL